MKRWLSIFCDLLLLFVFTGALYSCTNNQSSMIPQPIYDKTLTDSDRALAEKSFTVFRGVCNPLMSKYSGDIESIKIESGFDRQSTSFNKGCLDYRCEDYGWDKQIYIQVKLKDKQTVIPNELRAWGHTLHFYLGGPKNPGITLNKIPELCGKSNPNPGSDMFISEPKLSFIKNN